MSRKNLLTKDEIIAKGFEIMRTKGLERLTSRDLAKQLGTSTQPIFSLFSSMEEVQVLVLERAKQYLFEFIGDIQAFDMPFKRFGLRIVDFAKEEPMLFDTLFTRGYLPDALRNPASDKFVAELCRDYQLTEEESIILFEQAMVFTYGLAQFCTRNEVFGYDEMRISAMLGRVFLANLTYIKANGTTLVLKHPQPQE